MDREMKTNADERGEEKKHKPDGESRALRTRLPKSFLFLEPVPHKASSGLLRLIRQNVMLLL
jgi:hypothetical protein